MITNELTENSNFLDLVNKEYKKPHQIQTYPFWLENF